MTRRQRGFRAWLRTMVCRPDEIGNLARFVEWAWEKEGLHIPAHPRGPEVVAARLDGILRDEFAADNLDLVKKAWAEFKRFEEGVKQNEGGLWLVSCE
jgi:hypothetical protein